MFLRSTRRLTGEKTDDQARVGEPSFLELVGRDARQSVDAAGSIEGLFRRPEPEAQVSHDWEQAVESGGEVGMKGDPFGDCGRCCRAHERISPRGV